MKIRQMIYTALFAALVAILGLVPAIPLPYTAVPITVQTLGVMLAGCLLAARWGSLSMVLFILIVMTGVPLLSGGRGGFAVITSVTGGFLLSWPFAVIAISWMLRWFGKPFQLWKLFIANIAGGILIVYAIGVPYWAYIAEIPITDVAVMCLSFIPGDLIKVALASIIASKVLKTFPQIRQS